MGLSDCRLRWPRECRACAAPSHRSFGPVRALKRVGARATSTVVPAMLSVASARSKERVRTEPKSSAIIGATGEKCGLGLGRSDADCRRSTRRFDREQRPLTIDSSFPADITQTRLCRRAIDCSEIASKPVSAHPSSNSDSLSSKRSWRAPKATIWPSALTSTFIGIITTPNCAVIGLS